MFMPPNVTPLIQPMDQNVSLLALVAAKGGALLESMKQTSLKEAITILESAWRRVDANVLSKCWNNVLNMVLNRDDPEDDIPLSVLRNNLTINLVDLEETATNLLSTLLPEVCVLKNVH